MASGVYPELDLRATERTRRRRGRGRGTSVISGVDIADVSIPDVTDVPGVISVDAVSGEVVIDLRTVEERTRSIDLVSVDTPMRETSPPTVSVTPRAASDH